MTQDTATDSASMAAGSPSLTTSIRKLTVLLLDLDDTLYPKSSNIAIDVRDRIVLYMKERLHIENAETLSYELYLRYGTTLKGLVETGYKELEDLETMIQYYHFVHDLQYDGKLTKNDTKLREMLQRIRNRYDKQEEGHVFRMVIFTNSDQRHSTQVLDYLGIRDLFDQFVAFEDIPLSPKPNREAYEMAMRRAVKGLPEGILEDSSVEKRFIFADDKLDNVQVPMDLFGWFSVFVNEDASKKEDAEKHGISKTIQTIFELEDVMIELEGRETPIGSIKSKKQPQQ